MTTPKTRPLAAGLIHHPYAAPDGFEAVTQPVYRASTVLFPTMQAARSRRWMDGSSYTYGLHGTPASYTLQARLATLEGARHVLLTASGLASIALVNHALLAAGDEVLLPDNVYGPSRTMARHELARFGITHRVYDPLDAASLTVTPHTRLVWLEAAGSVTMEFPDLRGLIRRVRETAPKAVIALDNTWGAGIAFDAFELGVDVTVHALTKYPGGGADLLLGSVGARDTSLYERLASTRAHLGHGAAPHDVDAVLRGLPTLALRYAAQDAAARRIARWCEQRPEFVRVLHPALPQSPGHAYWAETCTAAAGLLTVEVDPAHEPARTDAFVEALRCFGIGWSWGGPMSLAVPYEARGLRSLAVPYRGTLVRLCIGLEEPEVLIADLEQALRVYAA